jgi:plasmid stabilization system protein ParE
MKSGYEITWSKRADLSLRKTFDYLVENWTEKELKSLSKEIEKTIMLMGKNPQLFQKTGVPNVRRAVVKKLNSIFFHVDESSKQITVVSFFDNRQNPKKNRL